MSASEHGWVFGSQVLFERSQAEPEVDVAEGRRWGPFVLEAELGQGASGKVFRARYRGWTYALKILTRPSERTSARLAREAQLVGELDHPGVVPLRGAGENEGVPFLLYELVPDPIDLAEAWAEVQLARRVELVAGVAEAMGYAHSCGVVHRDLKPSNVLVDAGRPRVVDFGLATHEDLERMTQTGAMLGTPGYMAPEQFVAERDQQVPAVDVWSLGVLLYEALTGHLPFRSKTVLQLAIEVAHTHPSPPHKLNAEVAPALSAVCMRALSKRPEDRYADGHAFAQALRRAQAVPPPAPARTGRWVVALGLLAGAAVVAAVLVSRGAPAPAPRMFETSADAIRVEVERIGPEAMIRQARAALAIDKENVGARLSLAGALYASRDYESTLAELEPLLEQSDPPSVALSMATASHRELRQLDRALELADRAVLAEPTRAVGFLNRALILEGLGERDSALADTERAVELDPSNAHARAVRGTIQMKRQAYDLALADLDYVMQRAPNTDYAYTRAQILFFLKRYADALPDCDLALESQPLHDPLYGIKLRCLEHVDPQAARTLGERLVRDVPTAEVYYLLGRICWKAGDARRAREVLTLALRVEPDSPFAERARKTLARIEAAPPR